MRGRGWLVLGLAVAAAIVPAASANAATLASAGCREVSADTYEITLGAGGFASNTLVTITWLPASGLPLPVLTTTAPTDATGSFTGANTVVMDTPAIPGSAFPVEYTATDPAGNSAGVTVAACESPAPPPEPSALVPPETKDQCKDGFLEFADWLVTTKGGCVSLVASKNK